MPSSLPSHARVSRRRAALLVALGVVFTVPALAAQGTNGDMPAGSRVRLHLDGVAGDPATRGSRVTGEFVRLDADSVVVRTDGRTLAAPRAAVRTLAVREGRRPMGRAMWRGAAVGAGVGAVSGAVIEWAQYEECGPADFICPSRGGSASLGAIVGGVTGLVVGGFVGALARGYEWREVPLAGDRRVGLAFRPGRAGFSVAF